VRSVHGVQSGYQQLPALVNAQGHASIRDGPGDVAGPDDLDGSSTVAPSRALTWTRAKLHEDDYHHVAARTVPDDRRQRDIAPYWWGDRGDVRSPCLLPQRHALPSPLVHRVPCPRRQLTVLAGGRGNRVAVLVFRRSSWTSTGCFSSSRFSFAWRSSATRSGRDAVPVLPTPQAAQGHAPRGRDDEAA
jgi:hypothetical protein